MTRLAIHHRTRNDNQAIFDAGVQVPQDPFKRADLGVSKLKGVDDAFESSVRQAFGADATSVGDVTLRIARDGLDAVAHKIADATGQPAASVRQTLSQIDDLVSRASYFRLLPEGADSQIYVTGTGALLADPTAAPPTNVVDRLTNLHKLAKLMANTNSNTIDELPSATRARLLDHIEGVIDEVKGGGGGGTTVQVAKESAPGLAIPDNDATGVADVVTVDESGTLKDITVTVDLEHTYIGDLNVSLVAPDGREVSLHRRTGGSRDDLQATYAMDNTDLAQLSGVEIKGSWKLKVSDQAGQDVGKLNSWKLDLEANGPGGGGNGGADLTEDQEKAFYAGSGALLRRLARAGTPEEKDAAFAPLAELIKSCPHQNVRALMVAGLHQSVDELTPSAQAKLADELAPLVAPTSPKYDEIFKISYENGQPVANKRSLNFVVNYGSEEDDLIFNGGIQMIKDEGFTEQPSDKQGFKLFTKPFNQDDPDAPCQEVKLYVGHMHGSNMLSAMNDPDIDVIQYDGHSNLGRNIENSLGNAPRLAGNKVCVLGACATTDRMFAIRNKYPDTHAVQLVNTYESTYFNWREIDGQKVMDYSENMMCMFGLIDSMSQLKDWDTMNHDLEHATHSWSHSVDVNYTNPGKLEWLMLVDLDRDGVPDGIDSVWDGGRVIPDAQVREEFKPREPSQPLHLLDGTKVFEGTQSLNTLGRYNDLCKKAYSTRSIASGGFQDMGASGPMVRVSQTPLRGWKATVNSWYSHASVEAVRVAMHYEFIKTAMDAGFGNRNLSDAEKNAYALLFTASSLRFDNSYYDDRVWDGFLASYNFPPELSVSDFFHVIDVEHERPGHSLTGGYRNIDEVKERIGDELFDKLGEAGVGVWQGDQ